MTGTLLVALSALITAVVGAASIGFSVIDSRSSWPDGRGADIADAIDRIDDPGLN
jgi:hypothetical protein